MPRDFAPVGYFGGAPMFITAAPRLGVKTLPELIALAKHRPGELAYGTNGPGRLTHLTGELLQSRTGIKLLMIPYSGGTAQVLNDVMGGRIPIAIDAYSGLAGAIEAGTVMPLAVASRRAAGRFPDLPTVAETLPGFEAGGWQVLVAPVGTPEAIVQKVNRDLIKALSDPETRDAAGEARPRRTSDVAGRNLRSSRASSGSGRRSCSRSAARADFAGRPKVSYLARVVVAEGPIKRSD